MSLYIIKCSHKVMGSTCYLKNNKIEDLQKASELKKDGWKVEVELYGPEEHAEKENGVDPGQALMPPS